MASAWLGKPKLVASAISPAYLAFQVNYVSNASGADWQGSYMLHRHVKYLCIYTVHMNPVLNGSSVLQTQ